MAPICVRGNPKHTHSPLLLPPPEATTNDQHTRPRARANDEYGENKEANEANVEMDGRDNGGEVVNDVLGLDTSPLELHGRQDPSSLEDGPTDDLQEQLQHQADH